MWNTALSLALALVMVALALITIIMALGRHERPMWIFAGGFNTLAIAFMLFPGQGHVTPWVSVILANLLVIVAHICLAWGIRAFYTHLRPFLLRFWLYAFVHTALMSVFTFRSPNYEIRSILTSALIIALTFEFLIPLVQGLKTLRRRIRLPIIFIIAGFVICHLIRIALLTLNLYPNRFLIDTNPISTFTFAFTLFFSVLWAGSIMILDGAQMMEIMRVKNIQMEALALHDELTGVFNRHSLDQTLAQEMERQDRYQQPLSLIMLDLDHFKRINDLHGHDIGDVVLTETARRVREAIRETDFLFRWGGEEFLVLVPHSDLAQAGRLAEKLCRIIRETSINPAGTITASFGVAERFAEESRDSWFKRVDQAMYEAKTKGRNRVALWSLKATVPAAAIHIEWRNEWDSGDAEIDRDHHDIIRMGNDLLNLSLSNDSEGKMTAFLDAMLEHIEQHFEREETILAATTYPDLKNHARRHRSLLSDARILRQKFIDKEVDASPFFYFLVDKIILDHMLTVDVGFFPYTKKKLLTARSH